MAAETTLSVSFSADSTVSTSPVTDSSTTKTVNKRVKSLAPSELFGNLTPNSTNSTSYNSNDVNTSFMHLKSGMRIQFRPYDTRNSWLDGYFWKFVKITSHRHKLTMHNPPQSLGNQSVTSNITNDDDDNDNDNDNDDGATLDAMDSMRSAGTNLSQRSRKSSIDSIGSDISDHSAYSAKSAPAGRRNNNDSFNDIEEFGPIRAVCTRDRDPANPDLGYIVFELPLDVTYFRLPLKGLDSLDISENNTGNNSVISTSPVAVENEDNNNINNINNNDDSNTNSNNNTILNISHGNLRNLNSLSIDSSAGGSSIGGTSVNSIGSSVSSVNVMEMNRANSLKNRSKTTSNNSTRPQSARSPTGSVSPSGSSVYSLKDRTSNGKTSRGGGSIKKYPKINRKQLMSWSVTDVKGWMEHVCKMRHLSDFKRLDRRNINGMKLIECYYNHSNKFNYFSVKSIQFLIGLSDKKLCTKIHSKLHDLVSRQKEKIRICSIPFGQLNEYIKNPMKPISNSILSQSKQLQRRNSITKGSEERKQMKRTLSRMDTKLTRLQQSVTSLVIYHDTQDSTTFDDDDEKKQLYSIESGTDIDTDYATDDDFMSPQASPNTSPKSKNKKKKKKKVVRFGGVANDKGNNNNNNNNKKKPDVSVKIPMVNNNSNESTNSINSEPANDIEFRDDNGDKGSKRRQRPNTTDIRRHRKGKSEVKTKTKAENKKLRHQRSKTAKFGNKGGRPRGRSHGPPSARGRHRLQNKTWTSVKDVFAEDFSIKTRKFEEKKKWMQEIGAMEQDQDGGRVPEVNKDFKKPEYMQDYELRLLKDRNKYRKHTHSNDVYSYHEQNYFHSSARLEFDDTALKQTMTVQKWPEFASKRAQIKSTNSNTNTKTKRHKGKNDQDLWKDVPPGSYHAYQKWLQKVEKEVTKVENGDNNTKSRPKNGGHKRAKTGKMTKKLGDSKSTPVKRNNKGSAPSVTPTVIRKDNK